MGSSSQSSLSVAVLYSFKGSCWAAASRLALIEKGYGPDDCSIKNVDLFAGANFSPEYLRVNTSGTVPTLVVPQLDTAVNNTVSTRYTALTDTVSILSFLDTHRNADSRGSAPARSLQPSSVSAKEKEDALIRLVHTNEADPNFLLLSARNESELKAKAKGIPGTFANGRMTALEGYLKEAEGNAGGSERLINFYKQKLAAMEELNSVLSGTYPPADYFHQSKTAWTNLQKILITLNALLPKDDRSGFITLSDLHIGAWFARILAVTGAKQLADVEGSFSKLIEEVPARETEVEWIRKWWSTMVMRKSFQNIYAEGLF